MEGNGLGLVAIILLGMFRGGPIAAMRCVAAVLFIGAVVLPMGGRATRASASSTERAVNPQPSAVSPQISTERAPRALPAGGPIRWAYYYPPDPSSLESLRANLARLDVVAPHWLVVDEEGRLRGSLPAEARELLGSSNVVVLPSVALATREAGARVFGDAVLRAAVVEQLVSVAVAWDGLALDFEGLDSSARDELSELIHTLGVAVRRAGRVFAVALPAKTSDVRTGWSGAYDLPAIAEAADVHLVMAYGFRTSASAQPGSTAPLPWVEATMRYTTSVIPPERVILGVAFYGYDWNVDKGPPARALRFSDAARILNDLGISPSIDATSLSATFRYTHEGEQHEVWFEDRRSLEAKLGLVAKYGLRGAGAWRLGQEDPSAWGPWDSLLAGIERATPAINASPRTPR